MREKMFILKVVLTSLGIFAYLFLVIFFRRYRQWLFYYMVGAFGLTLIIIFTAKVLKGEPVLAFAHLYPLNSFLNILGIKAKVFYPSMILVSDPFSFSLLNITIECSSLIEFSVLAGLILFYPVFRPVQKGLLLLVGTVAIYLLNLIRILIIASLVHFYGPPMVFASHAIFGRLFFFLGIIIVFWHIFTRSSLTIVKQRIEGETA